MAKIDMAGLLIPSVSGSKFTWQGKRRGKTILKRLDYFLCNSHRLDHLPDSHIDILPRTASDHAPILFRASAEQDRVARLFRFLNMWLTHPKFQQVVSRSWNEPIAASGLFKFLGKLNRLKKDLKRWNANVFGNVFVNKAKAKAAVREAGCELEESLSPEAEAGLRAANENLNTLLSFCKSVVN